MRERERIIAFCKTKKHGGKLKKVLIDEENLTEKGDYLMITNERTGLIAPCGIDCGICELYLARENEQLRSYLISKGVPEEKLPCNGCRQIEGNCPVIGSQCATYACVVQKEVDYCHECQSFPCSKLHPSSDRADVLPHNLKVFNLCTIRRDGEEAFIRLSKDIKTKYFNGKMVIGSGPETEG